jgi:hypothetical protein
MVDHCSHQDQTQISINQIIQQLKARYNADQPYVNLGSHRLIVLNPHKPLDLLNDATLEVYGQHGYKNISYQQPQDEQKLEPHIYELATKVYFLLRRRNEDQAIILRYVYILRPCYSSLMHTNQQWPVRIWKVYYTSSLAQGVTVSVDSYKKRREDQKPDPWSQYDIKLFYDSCKLT